MSAPVKQVLCDHLDSERDLVADPGPVTIADDWATAFEFGGAR